MSRKDKKAEIKASSAELRKKEKENRRLQQVISQLIKCLISQLILHFFSGINDRKRKVQSNGGQVPKRFARFTGKLSTINQLI